MIACTFSGNTAGELGGAILDIGSATLINSTLTGNTGYLGGGLYNFAYGLTIDDCTVAGNKAVLGGGLFLEDPTVLTMNNTIVASSVHGGDIASDAPGLDMSGSNNLIGDGENDLGLTGTITGDPMLGPLASNGGPTQTMAPLAGSPAIDAGDNAAVPTGIITDQRGAPRIKGAAVDIGAFETGPQRIVVTTLADSGSSGISLRGAIDYVNTIDPVDGDTISFAAGLTGTISLSQGPLPTITANVAISGPGENLLSIDGDGNGSILTIDAGSSVILSGLSLVDGSSAFGGAIRNLGAVSMTACTVSGDSAVSGGGIFNDGTLIMVGSTLSGNSAGIIGGGISNAGTMSLTNCTVYGNTTPTGLGGGIYNYGSGTLTLNACTISGNSATSGGGLYNYGSADATLDNTIVANSSTGGDIAGTVAGSNNLIDDATSSGGLTNQVNGNLVGVNPMLGVLRNNGGPTQTMALLPVSPAINAGASALVPAFLTTDQRGAPRQR